MFEEAREAGDDLVYIAISSALSGTFQCANVVKAMGEYNNVHLVDSRTASLGQKLLVLHAAALRDRGSLPGRSRSGSPPSAAVSASTQVWTLWNTCKRADGSARPRRALGTLARVKPVITLSKEGTVQVAGKCLGKSKAMSQISALLSQSPPDPAFPLYGVYCSRDENLTELREKLRKTGVEIPDENCFGIGPVIGAHIGPGAYGVVYMAKE